jgi:hypothetical protein
MAKPVKLAAFAVTALRDVAGLAGAGSIAWGCFLVHPALGYIVVGALLLAAAIVATVRGVVNAAVRAQG